MRVLNNYIGIYIPVDYEELTTGIAAQLAAAAGGATVSEANCGWWGNATSGLFHEEIEFLEAWYDDASNDAVVETTALAVVRLLEEGEEAVMTVESGKSKAHAAHIYTEEDLPGLRVLAKLEADL